MIFLINRFSLKDQWFDSHRLNKSNIKLQGDDEKLLVYLNGPYFDWTHRFEVRLKNSYPNLTGHPIPSPLQPPRKSGLAYSNFSFGVNEIVGNGESIYGFVNELTFFIVIYLIDLQSSYRFGGFWNHSYFNLIPSQ